MIYRKFPFTKVVSPECELAFQINEAYQKLLEEKKFRYISSLISTLNTFVFIKLESVSTTPCTTGKHIWIHDRMVEKQGNLENRHRFARLY